MFSTSQFVFVFEQITDEALHSQTRLEDHWQSVLQKWADMTQYANKHLKFQTHCFSSSGKH